MRKRRKPKDTALWDQKDWKQTGDELVTEIGRGMLCAVCGTPNGVCLHHLLPKSRFDRFRFRRENLLPLCPSHHKFSNELAAHAGNALAVQRFSEWLALNHPLQDAWIRKHECTKVVRLDWRKLYAAFVSDLELLKTKGLKFLLTRDDGLVTMGAEKGESG